MFICGFFPLLLLSHLPHGRQQRHDYLLCRKSPVPADEDVPSRCRFRRLTAVASSQPCIAVSCKQQIYNRII
jgi:hypothetical protein